MSARTSYHDCIAIARAHYENFPVASRLLPASLRGPVAAIYVFARRADDIADEGDATTSERIAALDAIERDLVRTLDSRPPDDPLWRALADAVTRFDLPAEPLHDLLSAFREDATHQPYEDFTGVLAYCERSANPVGRLLLHLQGAATPANLRASDAICTGLQLINFLQDLGEDLVERDRLYIPLCDLARHGVSRQALIAGEATSAVQTLLAEQVERAAWWLYAGRDLPERLRGRFAMEIRLIIRGGWRVVERLRVEKPSRPFARPRLTAADKRWILRGLLRRRALPRNVRPPADPVRTRLPAHDHGDGG